MVNRLEVNKIELVTTYMSVNVELRKGRSRDENKNNNKVYIIKPLVKVDGIPESIEIDSEMFDRVGRDYVCYMFDSFIKIDGVIRIGLGFKDSEGYSENGKVCNVDSIWLNGIKFEI